ncbi:MAG: DUF4126 domain-containing protein [Gemmatimonas sp.]|jgi:hypothetical protein
MDSFPVTANALLGIAVGFGLASAAGFRVFVPLLAAAIAAKSGVLTLSPGFEWIATTPALAALGTATILEVGAYSVPWLDQLLDLVATPAAMLAGMLAAASVVVDLPPVLKWSAVLLAGGAAGVTQGATVFTRFKSTTLTGGVGNPIVSTLELVSAVVTSVLAIFLPIVTLVAVLLLFVFFTRRVHGVLFGRKAAREAAVASGGPPKLPRGPVKRG